jgi:hypothetical protein
MSPLYSVANIKQHSQRQKMKKGVLSNSDLTHMVYNLPCKWRFKGVLQLQIKLLITNTSFCNYTKLVSVFFETVISIRITTFKNILSLFVFAY